MAHGDQDPEQYRWAGQFRVPADFAPVEDHPTEATEWPYARFFIAAIKRWMRLADLEVTVVGAEHVPTQDGALLVSNHTNYLDMAWVGVPAHVRGRRLVRFMAKKEVFDHKMAGPAMRSMKHVAVDRFAGTGSIGEAVTRLQQGNLVGIFPEATISRSFEIKELKTGAVRIAAAADVPLLPVVTWGGQRIWTKGGKKKLGRTHTPVRIHVGAPVDPSGDPEEATARLRATMQSLLDDARAAYDAEYGPFPGGEPWRPASEGGSAPTLAEADRLDEQYRAENQAKREAKAAKAAARAEKGWRARLRGLWKKK